MFWLHIVTDPRGWQWAENCLNLCLLPPFIRKAEIDWFWDLRFTYFLWPTRFTPHGWLLELTNLPSTQFKAAVTHKNCSLVITRTNLRSPFWQKNDAHIYYIPHNWKLYTPKKLLHLHLRCKSLWLSVILSGWEFFLNQYCQSFLRTLRTITPFKLLNLKWRLIQGQFYTFKVTWYNKSNQLNCK